MIEQSRAGAFRNPPGFYVSLLKENVTPPESFENTRKRQMREEAREALLEERAKRQALEREYDEYCSREVERYIAEHLSPEEVERTVEAKKRELLQQYPGLRHEAIKDVSRRAVIADLKKQIPAVSFTGFCKGRLFES